MDPREDTTFEEVDAGPRDTMFHVPRVRAEPVAPLDPERRGRGGLYGCRDGLDEPLKKSRQSADSSVVCSCCLAARAFA